MLREEANKVIDYLDNGGYLTDEVRKIINDHVINEDVQFNLHQLRGRYELKKLIGYSVASVIDTTNEANENGSLITFKKPTEDGCSCIELSLSGDGNIYISDEF